MEECIKTKVIHEYKCPTCFTFIEARSFPLSKNSEGRQSTMVQCPECHKNVKVLKPKEECYICHDDPEIQPLCSRCPPKEKDV